MNKIKKFFRKVIKETKGYFLWLQSLFSDEEEHILLNSLSTDPVKLPPSLEVTTVPNTFVKTFVYDYAEDLDETVNHYAEKNELEIISISICHTDVFVASVVFERGFEL